MGKKEIEKANALLLQVFRYLGKEDDTIMYLFDVEEHIGFFNQATTKLFDIPELVTDMPESIMKRDFLLPESKEEFIRLHHLVEEDALEAVGTLKLKNTNGTNTIYELKLTRILNEDGTRTNGVIGRIKDVTQRYVKTLNQSYYSKIIEGNKKLAINYDKKKDMLKISYADSDTNEMVEKKFFFYSRLVKDEQVCAKADVGVLLEYINNGSKEPIQLEIFDQLLEEYRWYAFTGEISKDDSNIMNGIAEDITDLKNRGNNKERLNKVLNILSEDYILIYEVDLVNDRYEALLGDYQRIGFMFAESGVYSEENERIANRVCINNSEARKKFGSIENIVKELSDKQKIVYEFQTNNVMYPWRKAVIQKVEVDEEGNPTKVLLSHIYIDENELESQIKANDIIPEEKKKRILVVEDYELNAKIVIDNVHIAGMEADWASTKEDAVKKVSSKEYSMVLMDDKLGKESGYEASKEIRNLKKNVPIIICSLIDSKDLDSKCKKYGITDHVSKPIVARQIKYLDEKYVK